MRKILKKNYGERPRTIPVRPREISMFYDKNKPKIVLDKTPIKFAKHD